MQLRRSDSVPAEMLPLALQLSSNFSFNYEKHYIIRSFGSRVILVKIVVHFFGDLLVVEVPLRSYFLLIVTLIFH